MAAGALLLAGPAFLRLRFGVDEVVTTLLLNFIVILFVGLMIEGPLRDPLAFGWPQSVPVDGDYRLPDLVPRTRLHIGLLIAIAAAGLVWLILARTVFGVETRAAGLNARAAAFAGISLPRTIMGVALMSGALAGLAGSVEVMGVTGGVTTTMSPGFGYAGIVVAMLAALHPVGVVAAALFRGHRLRGRGCDDPGHRRTLLHRRCDRRAVASYDARGAVVHQLQDPPMSEALDLLVNTSLWAAVLRIATPLIFGVLGALLCERAGVLNLGIEGIMTMGAMAGWLTVFLGGDLWMGLAVAAVSGALMGLLHAMLTVPLGPVAACVGAGHHALCLRTGLLSLPSDRSGGRDAADDRALPSA